MPFAEIKLGGGEGEDDPSKRTKQQIADVDSCAWMKLPFMPS